MDEHNQGQKRIFREASVYRTTGQYLHNREQFEQARCAYDQAFKSATEDVDTLIRRSRLCADAFYPHQALKDAEDAVSIAPRNLDALLALANANYSMLEFEKSITLNYRGLKRRRKPGYFRMGINQGIACINETIGKDAGDVMLHYLPLIEKHAEVLQESNEHEDKKHVSRIPCPKRVVNKTPLEVHRQELTSRVLAYKYLEPLAYDKFFLKELVEDPRLKAANKTSSKKLKELAGDALQTLAERQDMLQAQCLYRTLQRKQKSQSQHQTKYKKKLLASERESNHKQAEQLLRHIEACKRDNRIHDMMRKVKNMQCFLDSKTTYTFPDKDIFVDRLYRNVGEGYLSQNRLSYNRSYQSNRRRVSFLMGLHSNRPTSFDSVVRNYPQRNADPKVALKNALHSLETAENPNMKCWLCYEISLLQIALKNYPMSKFYAQNCQKEAKKIDSHVWWLNGCFSLISGDVQQGNVNEVIRLAKEAYEWARKTGKPEETLQFLLHCIEIANDVAEYDSGNDVDKRKSDILNMMDQGSSKETKLLFNKISGVPKKRQFSVLPRKKAKRMAMESARKKTLQRNLTIVPGPEKELRPVAYSPVPGFIFID